MHRSSWLPATIAALHTLLAMLRLLAGRHAPRATRLHRPGLARRMSAAGAPTAGAGPQAHAPSDARHAAGQISDALRAVNERVQSSASSSGRSRLPRLVAVSKLKPVSDIKEAYDAGHRVFGENYVQELVDKAPQLPDDLMWHFIGHLQSNKAKALVEGVPNLGLVETVDSEKLANKLDAAVAAAGRSPLRVLVQVNTSGEASKSGVEPEACLELARHVTEKCPNLRFAGLMTIGMADYTSRPENFQCLVQCREEVCRALSLPEDDVELSMGMSGDFEQAVALGSTNIRVGSTIFGARPPKH